MYSLNIHWLEKYLSFDVIFNRLSLVLQEHLCTNLCNFAPRTILKLLLSSLYIHYLYPFSKPSSLFFLHYLIFLTIVIIITVVIIITYLSSSSDTLSIRLNSWSKIYISSQKPHSYNCHTHIDTQFCIYRLHFDYKILVAHLIQSNSFWRNWEDYAVDEIEYTDSPPPI